MIDKEAIAVCEKYRTFLLEQVNKYNRIDFISDDPISLPHRFYQKQDIEIAGFFSAILSWGNRKAIIKSCRHLLELMDNSPYDFITGFTATDLKPLSGFVYRTYNATDLFYTLHFLKCHYRKFRSLENAFTQFNQNGYGEIRDLLTGFHHYFFSCDNAPERTRKHIATPEKHSACKRLNMFLRWMVRKDVSGVDFGIWKRISPSKLICPLDVHSGTVARTLGLLTRKANDWEAAEALTEKLRYLNPDDPVMYDFALFGMGVSGNDKNIL